MYYNIKIITDDSELSLDSTDKKITQREMDLYFAAIFKASDDFRANIKEAALKRGYKKSAIRSLAELADLAESASLKKYEANLPKDSLKDPASKDSVFSRQIKDTKTAKDTDFKITASGADDSKTNASKINDFKDDLKAYEIKNTSLASSEIVSIKNLKEKQDIFAKINRKEFFSEKDKPKEAVKFEKINTDFNKYNNNSNSRNSRSSDSFIPSIKNEPFETKEISFTSVTNIPQLNISTAPTEVITQTPTEAPTQIPTIIQNVSTIASTLTSTAASTAAPVMASTIAPAEIKFENPKTTDEILLETFSDSAIKEEQKVEQKEEVKEEIKEEAKEEVRPELVKTPIPTLADYIIRNEELRTELSRDDLNKLRNEYRNELIKEDKAKNGSFSTIAPVASQAAAQANTAQDNKFELGSFELKELSQTQTEPELPEIETIINETKDAVQKEETLNTLFGPEISPTVIDEITLDELANRFNETNGETTAPLKADIIEDEPEADNIVTPTPVATKQTPISLPALSDTMISPVAAVPVLAQTSANPHPSIEDINKVLEQPQIPMHQTKPTIAEIEASLAIKDDDSSENKLYDVLESAKQKEQNQDLQRPFGVNLTFSEYIENFDCRNIYDEFLGCAYYFKHYLKQESFSIKAVNAKLYQAKSKIANMSVVNTLVDNEYLTVLPQENSNLYSISKLGEKYFKDKLKI